MTNPGTGLDLVALRAYLLDSDVELTGELSASQITGGRSNLTYRVHDDTSEWVLRRPPLGELAQSAHDVGREYRIAHALTDSEVPVAPTVVNCADPAVIGTPFTLVGFVPGATLRTQADLDNHSDDSLQSVHDELIRVLVTLHAVPYEEFGLADFGRPDGFFARQVRRWRRQWDTIGTRQLDDLDRLHAALAEIAPAPQAATIVHGDYRVDNTLLDEASLREPHAPTRVLAVLDWEMSTLGDPLTDVATMCAYSHPDFDYVAGEPAACTSPRWPGPTTIVSDYAAASGRDLSAIGDYLALAYFKLAVIAEGITARNDGSHSNEPGYATADQAVPGLLAAGLAALGRT